MDKVDKTLIRLLCQNSRYTLKELAENVFMSPTAVAGRLERLEAEGVIRGFSAQVDYHKLGYSITAFISLQIPPEKKETFIRLVPSMPEVVECHCITGNYSALIKGVFKSTSELDAFVMRIHEYGATQTEIVFCTPVEPRAPEI